MLWDKINQEIILFLDFRVVSALPTFVRVKTEQINTLYKREKFWTEDIAKNVFFILESIFLFWFCSFKQFSIINNIWVKSGQDNQ